MASPKVKAVVKTFRLQLPAGKATPADISPSAASLEACCTVCSATRNSRWTRSRSAISRVRRAFSARRSADSRR